MYFSIKTILISNFIALLITCSACHGQSPTHDQGHPSQSQDEPIASKKITFPAKGIHVVFQDSQGHHWFAGQEGIYKYTAGASHENKLQLFTLDDGICSIEMLSIQEDHTGNIYFEAHGCVSKFDGQRFTTLEIAAKESLASDWQLNEHDLWFRLGYNEPGPYRYDGSFLYALEFPKTPLGLKFYEEYPAASYSPYGIYSMYKDSKGSLWFGTSSLGVARYDGQTISWLYEKQLTKTPNGGDFGIRSIMEDDQGHFWFCTTNYRFEIFAQPKTQQGTSYLQYNRKKGIKKFGDAPADYPYFQSMTIDDEGDMWMMTYDDGVWQLDDQQLIHHPVNEGGSPVFLSALYLDNLDDLWLTTRNAGLYKFNGSTFVKFGG